MIPINKQEKLDKVLNTIKRKRMKLPSPRVSAEEYARFEELAKYHGQSLEEWLLELMRFQVRAFDYVRGKRTNLDGRG